MMKKAINYYRSFYDVSKNLNKEQYYEFNNALMEVMFFERHIEDVIFKDVLLSAIWASVKHSVQASIKGFCDKKGISYDEIITPLLSPLLSPLPTSTSIREQEQCTIKEAPSDVPLRSTSKTKTRGEYRTEFELVWSMHSEALRRHKTKSGKPRTNSQKDTVRHRFESLSSKYSVEAVACYARDSSLDDFPKELLNLLGKSLNTSLLEVLSKQDKAVLEDALNDNDRGFIAFMNEIRRVE